MGKWCSRVLTMACLVTLTGCDDTVEVAGTQQIQQSQLTLGDKGVFRKVLGWLSEDGPHGADVFVVVRVIAAEARRYFAESYTPGAIVITNQALDLTSPAVLREFDLFGNWDPDGGFERFREVTHNLDGSVGADLWAYQVARQFSSGAVSGYSFTRSSETLGPDEKTDVNMESFDISENVKYDITKWHQQKQFVTTIENGNKVDHSESYKYQSHPILSATLAAGGRFSTEAVTTDRLVGDTGWTVEDRQGQQSDLQGTLTFYRPVEAGVEENQNPEQKLKQTEGKAGGKVTLQSSRTDVDESSIQPEPYVEEWVTQVKTVTTEDVVDEDTGLPLSQEEVVLETVFHRFRTVMGKELAAIHERWTEKFMDYKVTVRTVTSVTYTYDTQKKGDSTKKTTVTEYRFTDNPFTRNDLYEWRSTTYTDTEYSFTDEKGTTVTVTHSGVSWLTDRYEPDPDATDLAFSHVGTLSRKTREEARFLGDDVAGLKETVWSEFSEDVNASVGGDSVSWKGGHVVGDAGIDNGTGDAHDLKGDPDGVYAVVVNGREAQVSAEEWVDELH